MASNTDQSKELLERLMEIARSCDCQVMGDGAAFSGEREAIVMKWLLGSRRVRYRFECLLDAPARVVTFREAMIETSRGLMPPTRALSNWSQTGTDYSETRGDAWPGGGGSVDFGALRRAFEAAVAEAGWTFRMDRLVPPKPF